MKEIFEVANARRDQGAIGHYAIGAAVGATFRDNDEERVS
jgi:hypothetical protein